MREAYHVELEQLADHLAAMSVQVADAMERATRALLEADLSLAEQVISDDAKVDAMSNQLIWETRIFEDRHKVVRFVCEVPTAIDQRLFALGRVIQQEME